MRFGFMNRLRNGYGNIYTPHAGSMIIQVQRESGLANRTIVISERQVALVRLIGSRIGVVAVVLFLGTWLVFAVQSVRVPVLSIRIAELERDNKRIDSLQVALSRMHGRYEQVRQLLAAGTTPAAAPRDSGAAFNPTPNVKRRGIPLTAEKASVDSSPSAVPSRPDTGSVVPR
jgi:hypothetical protein